MKKNIFLLAAAVVFAFAGCKSQPAAQVEEAEAEHHVAIADWTEEDLATWIESKAYFGDFDCTLSEGTRYACFANHYMTNPERWDAAFAFLANTDFSNIEPGEIEILGRDVYAIIPAKYAPKAVEDVKFESHQIYADIQYIAAGKEQMGGFPTELAEVYQEYDAEKDLCFAKLPEASADQMKFYPADPSKLIVFFPEETHAAGIKVDDSGEQVQRVVIKVKL